METKTRRTTGTAHPGAQREKTSAAAWRWAWWLILVTGASLLAWILLGSRGGSGAAAEVKLNPADIVYSQPLRAGHAAIAPSDIVPAEEAPSASGQFPQALLPATFFDFGLVDGSSVVQKEFYLGNSGDSALVVRQAYTTCTCTTAELSATLIPPGKYSQITVTFDPRVHALSGTTVRRGLILQTNDPANPEIEIWVQATVR